MTGKWTRYALLGMMLAALALSVSGCAALGGATTEPEAVTEEGGLAEEPLGEEKVEDEVGYTSSPAAGATSAPAAEAPAESGTPSVASGYGGGPDDASSDRGGGESGGAGAPLVQPTAVAANPVIVPPDQQYTAPLQAGEIDDNENFEAYLQYRLDFFKFVSYEVHDVDISERHLVRVTTSNGLPVLGATVLIYEGQNLVTALRTTATGQAYFFPLAFPLYAGAQSYTVTVQKGQASQSFTLTRENRDAVWPVTLDVPPTQPPVNLDVLFLLDATGSMGDEIDQLKNNILSISAQIEALPSNPNVRFGLVHYKDRGDEYVVRTVPFTDNVQQFQNDLMNVYAAGGGDDPESLNEALHNAVVGMDWRVEDTVSLIFLVADAPPHLDYPQDFDYAQDMVSAAQLGIKIFPIASRLDGADYYQQQAEYIFRQLAQYTGGHFIFLTYQDTPTSSGEPGTEAHVQEDSYSVEDLDALVVRLVQDELAALSGEQR